MANLFDYLAWRGDLPLEKIPFCELDAMILARLSYLPLEVIVSADMAQTITIREASDRIAVKEASEYLWKGDDRLIGMLGESERFRHLKLSGFVNRIDEKKTMQFCALIIELAEDLRFLSFRGTDNTLVGWQEDFNLFYEFPVPSQEEALRYFEAVYAQLGGEWLLGGHSKGGNLAIYAASFCGEAPQRSIRAIFNMDGPGFEPKHLTDSTFEQIRERTVTYLPQSSVFGKMFEHREPRVVVQSDEHNLWQHDIYSWQVERDKLVRMPGTNSTSAFFDQTLTGFVGEMTHEERKQFVEALFRLLKSTEHETFDELAEQWLKSGGKILKSFTRLDSDTRSMILNRLFRFLKKAGGNLPDRILPTKDKNQNI